MKPYHLVLAGTATPPHYQSDTASQWRAALQDALAERWCAHPHRRLVCHSAGKPLPSAEPLVRLDVLSPAPDLEGESLLTRLAQSYEAQHDPAVSYRAQCRAVLAHDAIWHFDPDLTRMLVALIQSGRAEVAEQAQDLAELVGPLLEAIPERFEHTSIRRFGETLQLGPVLEERADGVMFEHQGHRLFVNDQLHVGTVAQALLEQVTHLHDLRSQLQRLGEEHIRSYRLH